MFQPSKVVQDFFHRLGPVAIPAAVGHGEQTRPRFEKTWQQEKCGIYHPVKQKKAWK